MTEYHKETKGRMLENKMKKKGKKKHKHKKKEEENVNLLVGKNRSIKNLLALYFIIRRATQL